MSRFGSTSLLNIDEAVENTVPVNTKRSKTCVWTQCTSFCKEKGITLKIAYRKKSSQLC
jgi:hypothetical protein